MISSLVAIFGIVLGSACLVVIFYNIIKFVSFRKGRMRMSVILASLNRVEIKGLNKLVDPLEEAFLRQSLSRREFAELQRNRIRSVLKYFRKMARNAELLQTLGYRNLREKEDMQRFMARKLVEATVPVRMFTTVGILVLRLWGMMHFQRRILYSPSLADLRELVVEVVAAYRNMKDVASDLVALTEPGGL